jgi:hypothetical protein
LVRAVEPEKVNETLIGHASGFKTIAAHFRHEWIGIAAGVLLNAWVCPETRTRNQNQNQKPGTCLRPLGVPRG